MSDPGDYYDRKDDELRRLRKERERALANLEEAEAVLRKIDAAIQRAHETGD